MVAAPYFSDPEGPELIGIENKVNYIYRYKGNLEKNELIGLAALLNSKLFDTYFRTFDGNVNVSATELREMPMPPMESIIAIGNQIIAADNFSQNYMDEIVGVLFEMSHLTSL